MSTKQKITRKTIKTSQSSPQKRSNKVQLGSTLAQNRSITAGKGVTSDNSLDDSNALEDKDIFEYFSLNEIKKIHGQYKMIFGERSNGKTFACLTEIIDMYVKTGKQGAYLRRWKEDFRGKRGETLCDGVVESGKLLELTNNKWTGIKYYSGKWYLTKRDPDGSIIRDGVPFMYGFALSDMEHDKSTSYPNVRIIVFDEFMTRGMYLNNEFVMFCNVLSTIIRLRDDVVVYMLANTVNKYCPYFREMGIKKDVTEMEPGTIDVYRYGSSELRVIVQRTGEGSRKKKKPSDVYFAFDNPSLEMITGGAWEIDLYPHCPVKFKNDDIVFVYFIDFDGNLLQCEVVCCEVNDDSELEVFGGIGYESGEFVGSGSNALESSICRFTFIHEKTTPLKGKSNDVVFSESYNVRPNYFRNILKDPTPIVKKLGMFFKQEKVYYQDNEVGEVVRNYINWCKSN